MLKKIKESEAFLVHIGRAKGKITFFVRHKDINKGRARVVNIEGLLLYLVEKSKEIKKRKRKK
ncbi:hypothetical protein KJA16_00685 [Patescibacteria group bacterium]|nr:hypothetical protein [Patescibacteria group bacterium]MBZ9578228.1 hypothetical protein [Patescibacteria group bacterium]